MTKTKQNVFIGGQNGNFSFRKSCELRGPNKGLVFFFIAYFSSLFSVELHVYIHAYNCASLNLPFVANDFKPRKKFYDN